MLDTAGANMSQTVTKHLIYKKISAQNLHKYFLLAFTTNKKRITELQCLNKSQLDNFNPKFAGLTPFCQRPSTRAPQTIEQAVCSQSQQNLADEYRSQAAPTTLKKLKCLIAMSFQCKIEASVQNKSMLGIKITQQS